MRELWVMGQELKKMRREARRLLSVSEEERARGVPQLMGKLNRLGILGKEAKIEDILSLTVKDVLERRLQTRVYKKGLAKSMAQARQLITHGFIMVGERKVSSPSYLVASKDEDRIAYYKVIDLSISENVSEPKTEAKKPAAEAAEEEPAPPAELEEAQKAEEKAKV